MASLAEPAPTPSKETDAAEDGKEPAASTSKETPAKPSSGLFSLPVKRVLRFPDVEAWKKSMAWYDVVGFILSVNEEVKGKNISKSEKPSKAVQITVEFLRNMIVWVEEIPPVQQPMRFGNTSFRVWHARLVERMPAFLQRLLSSCSPSSINAAEEVGLYLRESFGSLQRIDYGTGHELNFAAFLTCLTKLGVFSRDEYCSVAFDVFDEYLKLMRTLQTTYWLEPAGSKGVWGLDDYQFLPFLWGASQMIDNPSCKYEPSSIPKTTTTSPVADQNMLFAAVAFVMKVKTGPFYEHSPLINDISQVPHWKKVNSGLIKMYHAEVLNKFPVVQHFFFGSILRFDQRPPSATDPDAELRTGRAGARVGSGAAPSTGVQAPWAAGRATGAVGVSSSAPWATTTQIPSGVGARKAPDAATKPNTGKTLADSLRAEADRTNADDNEKQSKK